MSRTVDPTDVKTFPLFGDGAGAVLLQPPFESEGQRAIDDTAGADSRSGILAYTLGSEGSIEALCVRAGGSREPISIEALRSGRQYMRMDGRSVFKWAVRCVVDTCRDILAATGYQASDVDRVILHQANTRIIDSAMADLGFEADQVIVNLDRYGNTSAASIPLAMAEAQDNGKLQRGDLVLLCGFGAGLTWGTALIRW
jgi:3-oxoacyl-[acyl-carrier-protein] synthase-3